MRFRNWLESHDQMWGGMEKNFTNPLNAKVYADWLEERGMDDVAELVRTAVQAYDRDTRGNMPHDDWAGLHGRYAELREKIYAQLHDRGYGFTTSPDGTYYSVSAGRIFRQPRGGRREQVSMSELEKDPLLVKMVTVEMTEKWYNALHPAGGGHSSYGRRTKSQTDFRSKIDSNSVDNKLRSELMPQLQSFEGLESAIAELARRGRNFNGAVLRANAYLRHGQMDKFIEGTRDVLTQFVSQDSASLPQSSPFLEWWLQRMEAVVENLRVHGGKAAMAHQEELLGKLKEWAGVIRQAIGQLKAKAETPKPQAPPEKPAAPTPQQQATRGPRPEADYWKKLNRAMERPGG